MSPRNAESAQPDLPESDANQIPMPRFRRGPEQPDTAVRRRPASVPAEEIRANSAAARPTVRPAPGPSLLPPVQELNKLRMLLQEERAKGAERHVEPVLVAPPVVAPPAPKPAEPAASVVVEKVPEPSPVAIAQPEPAPLQPDPMWFQPKIESAKRWASTFVAELKRHSLEAGSVAQQFWTRRVRIRLALHAPLQRIVSRPMEVCRTAVNAVRQNARLVNSLAMAALSALLVWGLIVTLRHHDPASKAARNDARHATVTANSASAAPAKAVAAKGASSAVKPNPATAASHASKKPSPIVQAADRKPMRKAAQHRANDDYVAPDTYVYYGKR